MSRSEDKCTARFQCPASAASENQSLMSAAMHRAYPQRALFTPLPTEGMDMFTRQESTLESLGVAVLHLHTRFQLFRRASLQRGQWPEEKGSCAVRCTRTGQGCSGCK